MHAYDFLFAFDVVDCGLLQCPYDFQVSKIIYWCSILCWLILSSVNIIEKMRLIRVEKKEGCASFGWWMTEIHQRRDYCTILSMHGKCSSIFFDSHHKRLKKCQKFMNKFLELSYVLHSWPLIFLQLMHFQSSLCKVFTHFCFATWNDIIIIQVLVNRLQLLIICRKS